MRSSKKLIIIVEPNGLYRHNIAQLIGEQTQILVKEFVGDGDTLRWLQTQESELSQVCLVIAHAYFRNEFGERNYQRTGALFQHLKERWPNVQLIALANSSFPNPTKSGYPDEVCFIDIDSSRPDYLLRAVDDLLHLLPA